MKPLLVSLAILSALVTSSQTIVSPGYVSGTWTAAGSPYLVQGDIDIGDDLGSEDSLFIEAGVDVIFENFGTLYVNGLSKLVVQGQLNDSVVFTVADTTGYYNNSHMGWGGIDFFYAEGDLDFSIIEYSKDHGVFESIGSYGDLHISNSKIRHNIDWAVDFNGNIEIQGSIIEYCGNGMTGGSGSFYFVNSEIAFCSGDGIVASDWGLDLENFNIHNCEGHAIKGLNQFIYITGRNGTIMNNGFGVAENGPEVNLSLDSVTIMNNIGAGIGGSWYTEITNCLVKNNQGGGIIWGGIGGTFRVNNCTIAENSGTNGGGIYVIDGYGTVIISNSNISNNIAQNGGGIYIGGEVLNHSSLINLNIENNVALEKGGGIFISGVYSLQLAKITVCSNTANQGGGIYTDYFPSSYSNFSDVLINGNEAFNNGGGIFFDYIGVIPGTSTDIQNLTIVNNTSGTTGGGILFDNANINLDSFGLRNNIIWGNSPNQIYDSTGLAEFSFSNIQNTYPGTGNIDADPMFTDPANGDYTLSWDNFPFSDGTKSPCIDSGSPDSDADPDGTSADMGYKPFDQFGPKVPEIISIPDVPGDQGKQVVINWTRSAMDHPDTAVITEYSIWREQDWADNPMEYMGSTPAQFFDEYAFIAPTVTDSSSTGLHYYKYVVIALTDQPDVFYTSALDSGYSVDNLSPDIPGGLSAYFTDELVFIEWAANTEEDFSHYNLYRSESPDSFPEEHFSQTADSSFVDDSIPEADTLYYQIGAVDINGNESERSSLAVPLDRNVIVQVRLYLEGPFNMSTGQMNTVFSDCMDPEQPFHDDPWFYEGTETNDLTNLPVVDWILLEIREGPDAASVAQQPPLQRKAVFVLENGWLVNEQGNTHISFDYEITQDLFVTVWHKNHLGVQSAFPLEKIENVFMYDFSLNSGQAFVGTQAHKEIAANTWGMIGGDGDRNGVIESADINDWSLHVGLSGFPDVDYNLDGQIDNRDKNDVWWGNLGKSQQITVINPASCGDPFIDDRDGQTYNTIQIGDQCWMQQNLNYETGSSWCYDNNNTNCNMYGRLYDWSTIMNGESSSNAVPSGVQGICPNGWHIPSDAEWCILTQFIDNTVYCGIVDWSGTDIGVKMKSTSNWNNGMNTSEFTALPAGFLNFGSFYFIDTWTAFWSSTDSDGINSWARVLNNDEDRIRRDDYTNTNGFSLRCIKD